MEEEGKDGRTTDQHKRRLARGGLVIAMDMRQDQADTRPTKTINIPGLLAALPKWPKIVSPEGNFLVKKLCRFKIIVPLQKYSAASELLCHFKNIVPTHKIGLIGRPRQ